MSSISLADFARARKALEEADVKDCKLYLHHSGALIAVNGKDKATIINEWALESPEQLKLTEEDIKAYVNGEPITYEPRMPLESPRKPAGEFK